MVLKNCNFEALKALMGIQEYFELPQMYTTSLFHSDLINQAKLKGNLVIDANSTFMSVERSRSGIGQPGFISPPRGFGAF
jgi:hypothetical protein